MSVSSRFVFSYYDFLRLEGSYEGFSKFVSPYEGFSSFVGSYEDFQGSYVPMKIFKVCRLL